MNAMNYLTRLTAQGLKSGDFNHELTRVNLIVGPSFSGKSSRIEAIRLGLIGYVPEIGRLPGATMTLARNGQMTVTVTDAQGRTNWREWKRGRSCTTNVDLQIDECPPVLMDPSLYFGLSDAKKIEYVFGLYEMEEHPEFSGPAISAAVQNIRLDQNTDQTEAIRRELVRDLDQTDTERHECGQTIQEWLGEQLAGLYKRLSVAKDGVSRMAKAGQAMTQLASDDVPVDRTKQIAEKRAALAAIQESIGSLAQSQRQYKALFESRQGLLDQLPAEVPVPDRTAEITELAGQIEQLERETDDGLTNEIAELERQLAGLVVGPEPALAGPQKRLHELSIGLDRIENEIAKLRANASRLAAEESAKLARPCCPECGAEGPDMRERIVAHYRKLATENDQALVVAEIALASKQAEQALADEGLAEAAQQLREWKTRRDEREQLLATHARKLSLVSDARMSRQRMINAKRREIQSLKDESAKAEQANARRREMLVKISAKNNELAEWNIGAIEAKLEDQRHAKANVEQAIASLTALQHGFERHKADEQRQAQAVLAQEQARAEVAVVAAAIEELEDVQSRMVAAAFGDILKTVNRITDGILDAPIEYRDGQLGRWKGSTFIAHETFSGTEKALTYAGISLALARSAPVKLVMIDELGRLDDLSLHRLLRRMVELTEAGEIGQFIGCLSDAAFGECGIAGVNLIDLTK